MTSSTPQVLVDVAEYEALKTLAKAGLEVASYTSYAEIVNGISVNRREIRQACDAFYEANSPYQKILLAREIEEERAHGL